MISGAETPLPSSTFVGRGRELGQLGNAYQLARSGTGTIVAVSGEPGIGKTTLCEHFASHIRAMGGQVLFGQCHEEESASLPYLPFVTIIRQLIPTLSHSSVAEDLAESTPFISRIVPDLRLEQVPARAPDLDRWQLLQGLADFFRAVSEPAPLVLLLEDLHWADRGTLDLLQHLSHNLNNAKLLVVATYRDTDVDPGHQLVSVLADFRRLSAFTHIPLRGLTLAEVHALYEALRGGTIPRNQTELVHRQTDGNPLFVKEILRFLVDEGAVVQEAGTFVVHGDTTALPEGLFDVVSRRLNLLRPETSETLAVASVMGREFSLDVLKQVSPRSDEDLLQDLEEATGRSIIESLLRPGSWFRFTHAVFRTVLYEGIFAPKRTAWHQQLGLVLEASLGDKRVSHAAELSEHFSQSADPSDLEKTIAYSEEAARSSTRVYAYEESVRYAERALQAHETLGVMDSSRRCQLLLLLGRAALNSGGAKRYLDELGPAIVEEAERIENRGAVVQACMMGFEAFFSSSGGSPWTGADHRWWADKASKWSEPGTVSEIWAEGMQGKVHGDKARVLGDFEGAYECRDHLLEALDLADRLGDERSYAFVVVTFCDTLLSPLFDEDKLELIRSLTKRRDGRLGVNPLAMSWVTYMQTGLRQEYDMTGQRLRQIYDRTHQPNLELLILCRSAADELFAGRLREAILLFEEVERRSKELGLLRFILGNWSGGLMETLLMLGETHPLFTESPDDLFMGLETKTVQSYQLLSKGREQDARALLVETSKQRTRLDALKYDIFDLEVALLLGEEEAISRIYERISYVPTVLASRNSHASVQRLLGDAAQFLGEWTAAATHYYSAIEQCERFRFRPELALSHLGLAEVAGKSGLGPRGEAHLHLDIALPELATMEMRPALRRGQALDELLGAQRSELSGGLSEREVQVLRLVAAGKSNQQIADELVVSLNTARKHVSNILGKTGSSNRAQAAVYARDQGLI